MRIRLVAQVVLRLTEADCSYDRFQTSAGDAATVRIDYRPVHIDTMTNEIKYITPKARVYWVVLD
jgi:hypothetical protein